MAGKISLVRFPSVQHHNNIFNYVALTLHHQVCSWSTAKFTKPIISYLLSAGTDFVQQQQSATLESRWQHYSTTSSKKPTTHTKFFSTSTDRRPKIHNAPKSPLLHPPNGMATAQRPRCNHQNFSLCRFQPSMGIHGQGSCIGRRYESPSRVV